MSPSCAYTTVITTENYIIAVQVLAISLELSGSKYPLVVLHTPNLDSTKIHDAFNNAPLVSPVDLTEYIPASELNIEYAFSRFKETWNKIRVWDALSDSGFDRVAHLDADMLILRNPDDVFSSFDPYPAPADVVSATFACTCNVFKNPNYPDWWKPENCAHTWHGRGEKLPGDKNRYFNSGFFVFRPSVATFQRIIKHIVDNAPRLAEFKFPDQDLLNEVYSGNGGTNPWIEVPYTYNALKTLSHFHKDVWKTDQLHIIHYILDKPWDTDLKSPKAKEDKFYELNRLWWNVHDGRAPFHQET
ncbi:nucleotide-diphospho-sugar transferase [Cladochytrium replicatum]|nr:nucleotide-diphospho-sugar transferase [Cladochytrium replicatum]